MTSAMGPPPPRNSTPAEEPSAVSKDLVSDSTKAQMPPPSENPRLSIPESSQSNLEESELRNTDAPQNDPSDGNSVASSSSASESNGSEAEKKQERRSKAEVPYTIPTWSEPPCHKYYIEILKDGSIIDQFDVNKKGAYMFGHVDLCDFVLEHPTISRFHAVLQFKSNGDAYIYDLGSTHGTFINKNQVNKRTFVELHVGDVIRFGQSSRLYIFQGPNDLMPPETDLKNIRRAKIRADMQDMEESLLRAKLEASLADGVSWGMREDAIEVDEDEVDEITWQTYKGQLTEKQEKTRDKVIKRLEKIAHMKKEIDAIRAKDIAQGGLTQGQQTQIARNEQRISQIMEELENLEETLNESIRESLGARAGRMSHGKKKRVDEEEEEYSSGEDEFYDRTQKPAKQKGGENQSVETADSLLDKKDAIVKEMEDKRQLLLSEDKTGPVNENLEAADELDVFMSGLSSQLVHEKEDRLRKELSSLQSELDRILYLLKIADPTGEAARKREMKLQEPKVTKILTSDAPQLPVKHNQRCGAEKYASAKKEDNVGTSESSKENKEDNVKDNVGTSESIKENKEGNVTNATDGKTVQYTVAKPQWLGAVKEEKKQEIVVESQPDMQENDQFVDYKDRERMLNNSASAHANEVSVIENAAPGLIIRKRKQVKSDANEGQTEKQSSGADMKAEEAIALLLKHSRGYHASDDENGHDGEMVLHESPLEKKKKKPKTTHGPDRPPFLDSGMDDETWVPPKGQSGDGRTSLNDRYGY
ncbi:PREDICTED: kanadaptin [Ipomoea nil]|uniref:kanadaptin n=1 Tax=Ipomoea nil TaxID=35883 RepID=UPI000901AB0E|nr:PREDICTED: kanadaptin [Ipomoea nil]